MVLRPKKQAIAPKNRLRKTGQQLSLFENLHPRGKGGKFKRKYSGENGLDEEGEAWFNKIESAAISRFNELAPKEIPRKSVTFTPDTELSEYDILRVETLADSVKASFSDELEQGGVDIEESKDWLDWPRFDSSVEDYIEVLYAPLDPSDMTIGEIRAELQELEERGHPRGTSNRLFALLDEHIERLEKRQE